MSSVVDKLTSIWESISNISSQVINGIGDFFSTLFDYLNPFSENFMLHGLFSFLNDALRFINPFDDDFILKILFDWIKDLLENIFIPDTEAIDTIFNNTLSKLNNKLGITMFNLDNLFDTGVAPTDIKGDYTLNGVVNQTFNFKFTNFDLLAQGVEFFRPWIRGMIVLLLFFFNIRQLMSMFGLDSGEMNAWYQNSKGRDE